MFDRVFIVVLDSLGIGHAEEAENFGDSGAHTLKSVMGQYPKLPNLAKLGLFNIKRAELGEFAVENPEGCFGFAEELSNGKDTTVGHWEIAGLISENALPTYPDGFPDEIIDRFREENGIEILCNKPYSGTEVIKDFGDEHLRTGKPIIYTSADSVFQIAAHEEVIPLEQLYGLCKSARKILSGRHGVGRVIARPFLGESGSFYRTGNRHDYSLEPTNKTLLDKMKGAGFDVISVGKISDIFAGRGITESHPTKGNKQGEEIWISLSEKDFKGICFVNLVDFDSVYGHRNDVKGYANALEEFDLVLGQFISKMKDDDLLIITADHGCDPCFAGTDHTRENIPIIAYFKNINGTDMGGFKGYTCIAKTVCDIFNIENDFYGKSFAHILTKGGDGYVENA